MTKLSSELLERKAEEEARISEKEKELIQIQRQFHDAMTQELESKSRLTKLHGDRLVKLEDDLKQQSDRLIN